jgi:hypothetical protein
MKSVRDSDQRAFFTQGAGVFQGLPNSRKAKALFHHPDWLPILVADVGCGGFDQVS